MSYEVDLPDSFDQESNFLSEPGTYHLAVLVVDEQPVSNAGQPLNGFRASCSVLDGTIQGQQRREIDLMFFAPKATDKNGGEMAKKKIARFAMATGIISNPQPGQRVTLDLQAAAGRQFVAELERQKDKTTGEPTRFLQLAWANIWHVDDPEVRDVPKSAQALALLPSELRRAPESFKRPDPPVKGAGTPAPQTPPPPAKPAAGAVNLDDL
jgi:hypothetical protein